MHCLKKQQQINSQQINSQQITKNKNVHFILYLCTFLFFANILLNNLLYDLCDKYSFHKSKKKNIFATNKKTPESTLPISLVFYRSLFLSKKLNIFEL